MPWVCRFDDRALKELRNLDGKARKDVVSYLEKRIVGKEDPRRFGKGLHSELRGLRRYRVGDYRIICQIQDGVLTVLVISVGHRRDIYR